jgi:O-antigen/teichoic acid export membrane protein
MLAKATNMVALIATLPITISYLGVERFGLLSTITATLALLSFADFGIGNGLMNAISEAYSRNDEQLPRRLVASATAALLVLSAVLFLCGCVVISSVQWQVVLHLRGALVTAECRPTLMTFLLIFCIALPAGVAQRVQYGFQEGYVAGVWQVVGAAAGILGTLLAVFLRASLPWFVVATFGTQTIATVCSWAIELKIRRPHLFPTFKAVEYSFCKAILKSGLLILSSQAGAAVLFSAPTLVLASMAGASAVAPFAILQRVFAIPLALTSAFAAPLWPAYAEAAASADFIWIRRTLLRSLVLFVGLTILPTAIIELTHHQIVNLLSHGDVEVGTGMALAVGIWSAVVALRQVIAVVAGGCNLLKNQAIAVPICALVAFLPALVHSQRMISVSAVPLLTAACEFVIVLVIGRDVKNMLRKVAVPAPVSGASLTAT